MSKPEIHARQDVRMWGGCIENYLPIHQLLDSSKAALAGPQHRMLTHNTWFIGPDGPLERIFGVSIVNSDGKTVQVRDIAENHCLSDYGGKFIPTAQDFLQEIAIQPWMENGKSGYPQSCKSIEQARKNKVLNKLKVD